MSEGHSVNAGSRMHGEILRTREAEWVNTDPASETNPCPALTTKEMGELRASIQRDGYIGPPVLVSAGPHAEGEIVDGNHRSEICAELGIEAPTMSVPIHSAEQLAYERVKQNLIRRQLQPPARVAMVRHMEPYIRAKAEERKQATQFGSDTVRPNLDAPGRADEELASLAGVSRGTYRKVAAVLDSEEDDLKERLLSGETSAHAASEVLAERQRRIDSEDEAEREIAEHYSTPQATFDERAEREAGELVRLVVEVGKAIRKLDAADVRDYPSLPHTFRATARRVQEWLADLDAVL